MMNESGLRKAAIVVMSLPTKDAASLLGKMPTRYLEAISMQIAQLDSVSGEEQEEVIGDFFAQKASALDARGGGLERAKELIREALGNNAADIIGNLQQTMESMPFGFVKKVDPQTLLSFIKDEHPQTIALLMSHVQAPYGAEVLAGLPPDKQLEVIRRISMMGRTSPEAVAELEKSLEFRLSSLVNQQQSSSGGVKSVAEILNVSERAVERNIMDSLSSENPELMDEIRRLMFVFEDIGKLSDRNAQILLKNVETTQWAMALKGASQTLQEKILRNMSTRAAENLREEIDFLGSVRLAEVEAVQQKIVDIVRSLEDSGELTRPAVGEVEEYIS